MLRSTHLLIFTAAVLLATAGLAERASAQGTFGALPDPISSRDLNEYARRLGLSDQQMLAIGEPHSRYLEQFRQLREREIEQFFDQFRGMRTRFDPSQLGTLEPIIRDFNRLMGRIRVLDESFFGEMQQFLTDDQAQQLPRIRMQRERSRYRSEATRAIDFLNPAVRVDLSEMIASLDLPPGDLEAIDELLTAYEHQLTTTSRRVFDSGMKTVLDGLKKLEALGLTEDMMNNPRQMMRMFDAFQEIWTDVTKDLLNDTDQLTNLNRRTFRQLSSMMPEDSWRLLREQYLGRAYPEAAAIGRSGESHFVAALAMEELVGDLRESIGALAAAHIHSQDRLADQMIDLLEQRRRNLSLMQMAGMGEDSTRARMDEIRARAEAADETAIDTLKAMLGPDLAEKLRPAPTAAIRRDRIGAARGQGGPGRQGPQGAQRARGPGGGGAMAMPGGMHRGAVAFLTETRPPDRISPRDARDLATRLDLDEMQTALLDALHDDYLARFESIRREHAMPYTRIVEQLRSQDDRSADPIELAERLDEAFALLQSLLDAVREADDQFFDDVQVAVIDADDEVHVSVLQGVRSARERARYHVPAEQQGRGGAAMAFGGAGGGEARVDLANVVASLDIERDQWRRIAPALAQYENEAVDLFRQRFQSTLDTHRQTLQFMLARQEGGGDRARFREMGERMTQVREAARTTNRALAELNRDTLVAVLDLLPDAAAVQLEDSYYRDAFPAAFRDPDSAEQRIQAALGLRDLTESQRSRILEVAADYRPLYMDLTYRILDHHIAMAEAPAWGGRAERGAAQQRGRGARGGDDRAAFTERMERASTLEVLNFDRAELNERTMRQLRTILRPDQLDLLVVDGQRSAR